MNKPEQQYFIRRGQKVVGPLTVSRICEGVNAKKYRARDEIGASRNGPWELLGSLYNHLTASLENRASTHIPTISEWTVKRSLLGNYKIDFVCKQCDAVLSSTEDDIGQQDSCPQCGSYFVVNSSVADEIATDREQRAIKKEAGLIEKKKQREEKQKQREEKQKQREEKLRQREEKLRQRDHEAEAQRAATQPAAALVNGADLFEDDSDVFEDDSDVQDPNMFAVSVNQYENYTDGHISNNGNRTVTCWYCGCTSTLLTQCPYCRMVPLRLINADAREH